MRNVLVICEESSRSTVDKKISGWQNGGSFLNVDNYDTRNIGKRRKGYEALLKNAEDKLYDTVICSETYLDIAVKLVWQVPSVVRLVLIDGYDPYRPEPDEKRVQSMLWDRIANDGDDSIQQSGWVSSITGLPFTKEEMDEYALDAFIKIKELSGGSGFALKKALEIGVASGLTCFMLAPMFSEYYGIDVSSMTIEKTKMMLSSKGITNVSLQQLDASEVDRLAIDGIDCIIINSVAQYFTGYNYFIDVLKKCIAMMSERGVIFVGDILNYEMLEEFDSELTAVGAKGRNRRDLWYPAKLLEELPALMQGVDRVEISPKIGNIENELKKYRRDAVLYIDNTKCNDRQKSIFAYSMLAEDMNDCALEYGDRDFLEVMNGMDRN